MYKRQAPDGSSFENQVSTHGQPLSAAGADFEKTIKNLGGDPNDPFKIFPEVAELYRKRRGELKEIVAGKKARYNKWAKANPELAIKKEKWFSRELPDIDWSSIQQKPNIATRAASATVLETLAKKVENMIRCV